VWLRLSIVLGRLRRGRSGEDFAWPVVGLGDVFVEFCQGELSEAGAFGEVSADAGVEVLIRAPLVGGVPVSEVGRNVEGVCESVLVGELAAVIGGHRRGCMRGHYGEHGLLRLKGGLRSDGGDLHPDQVQGGAFHADMQTTGAVGPEDIVSFPMPELAPVLDLGGMMVDRGAPLDPLRTDLPALSFPTFTPPAGQILQELAVSLPGRIDPRTHAFPSDSHTRIVGKFDREPAGDLFWCPPLPQMREHPVHQAVMNRPVRPVPTGLRLELCLAAKAETSTRATRVEPVAQIRAKIRVIMLWLPRTPAQLSGDRRPAHPHPLRDLRPIPTPNREAWQSRYGLPTSNVCNVRSRKRNPSRCDLNNHNL